MRNMLSGRIPYEATRPRAVVAPGNILAAGGVHSSVMSRRSPHIIEGACLRAARDARLRLARGQAGLSLISTTAPLFGSLSYAIGIISSFKGVGEEKTTAMAAINLSLSEAGIPMAFSLLVSLAAHVQYRAGAAQLEAFDTEMRAATLQLTNELR